MPGQSKTKLNSKVYQVYDSMTYVKMPTDAKSGHTEAVTRGLSC